MDLEITESNGVVTIDPKNSVYCDYCDKDWTNSDTSGGFLFGSYATCPDCAPSMEEKAKSFGEERNIRARCPDGKPFANWVREELR